MAFDLSDETVLAAAQGSTRHLDLITDAVAAHVQCMVSVRLTSTPLDRQEVDDIAQTVLTELQSSIGRIRTRTVQSLKAYLSGIVRHEVSDHLRELRRAPPNAGCLLHFQILDSTSATPLWTIMKSTITTPLTAAVRAEQLEIVHREFSRLDEADRELIILAFVDELDTADIAEVLGTSREAASMRLLRARRSLRQRLRILLDSGVDHAHAG